MGGSDRRTKPPSARTAALFVSRRTFPLPKNLSFIPKIPFRTFE